MSMANLTSMMPNIINNITGGTGSQSGDITNCSPKS
jgi:hypothetical protein